MYITKFENFNNNKIKIYIDEEYKFWLYNKELKKYDIEEDMEMSIDQYEELYGLNLLRAKKQIMNTLKRVDKTRQELINKLKQAGYNEEIIGATIEYIDSYNYIDDGRYACQYVRYKRTTKSKREITNQLLIKGVAKDIIEQAIYDEYGSEDVAIKNAIKKRKRSSRDFSDEDKRKLTNNLYNKGFDLDLIRKNLDLEEKDCI